MNKLMAVLIILIISGTSISQTKPKGSLIRLPDGSTFPVLEGETPQEAWFIAQKQYPEAFGLSYIPDENKMDIDWFNKCISDTAREAKTQLGVIQSFKACQHLAVPNKCRAYKITTDKLGNEVGDERIKCVKECAEASIYSKTLGECKKG